MPCLHLLQQLRVSILLLFGVRFVIVSLFSCPTGSGFFSDSFGRKAMDEKARDLQNAWTCILNFGTKPFAELLKSTNLPKMDAWCEAAKKFEKIGKKRTENGGNEGQKASEEGSEVESEEGEAVELPRGTSVDGTWEARGPAEKKQPAKRKRGANKTEGKSPKKKAKVAQNTEISPEGKKSKRSTRRGKSKRKKKAESPNTKHSNEKSPPPRTSPRIQQATLGGRRQIQQVQQHIFCLPFACVTSCKYFACTKVEYMSDTRGVFFLCRNMLTTGRRLVAGKHD